MNKNLIIGIVVLLLLIMGGFVLVKSQSQTEMDNKMDTEDAMVKVEKKMNDKDTMMKDEGMDGAEKDTAMKENETRYVAYSKKALDTASDNRRVLFFYANWCPTCRPADVDFKENMSKIPEDVTLIRVNYNETETDKEEEALAKQYRVTYQHTFVQIDSNGKKITSWNGGGIDELLATTQ